MGVKKDHQKSYKKVWVNTIELEKNPFRTNLITTEIFSQFPKKKRGDGVEKKGVEVGVRQ